MDRTDILASIVVSALSLAALGCGTTKPPPPAQTPVSAPPQGPGPTANAAPPANEPAANPATASAEKAPAKAAPGKTIAESAKPAAAPATAQAAAKEPTPTPVAAATPAKASPAPAPAAPAAPAPMAEPAKSPVAPAVSAHSRVGPEKCMMCHRIQYKSWSESKHKAKGLDCEGCHGNGADYKTIAVMKDLAAAKMAGLILPDVGFCKKCHPKADGSFLPTAHAHKAK